MKKYLRDCVRRRKGAKDDELTLGQGLNLTGAYQRRDRLTVSRWGWAEGEVDGSRAGGGSVRHHASPVRHPTSKVETWDWRHWHK